MNLTTSITSCDKLFTSAFTLHTSQLLNRLFIDFVCKRISGLLLVDLVDRAVTHQELVFSFSTCIFTVATVPREASP